MSNFLQKSCKNTIHNFRRPFMKFFKSKIKIYANKNVNYHIMKNLFLKKYQISKMP